MLKNLGKILLGMMVSLVAFAFAEVDPLLGEPFSIERFKAGDSLQFNATLIHYNSEIKATDSTRVDSAASSDSVVPRYKGAVLYVHGYNDYFFQRELAEKTDSAGYAFFALDLHNYGRSLQPGDSLGRLRALSDYYPELDSSLARIRMALGPQTNIVLLGHSTGGLIISLYAHDRRNSQTISGLVLNSPFFEMNLNWFMRKVAIPVASKIGKVAPSVGLSTSSDSVYSMSLRKEHYGEWEFDISLKRPLSPYQNLAWLRGIHLGHVRVQNGLKVQVPVLVMHSSCSVDTEEWVEEASRCDCVLDIGHITEYGAGLGNKVKDVSITDGIHDLFLSRKPARDTVYSTYLKFLDDLLK